MCSKKTLQHKHMHTLVFACNLQLGLVFITRMLCSSENKDRTEFVMLISEKIFLYKRAMQCTNLAV